MTVETERDSGWGLWGKADRKTRRERESAEEIKLEKGSSWDWLDVVVCCEITKSLFDGGLNVSCLLCLPVRLPVSPLWTLTLRKLFPSVKWIHRGTASWISEGRKMETWIWWRLQLRQTSPTVAGCLWLSHETIMTCSAWVDGVKKSCSRSYLQ